MRHNVAPRTMASDVCPGSASAPWPTGGAAGARPGGQSTAVVARATRVERTIRTVGGSRAMPAYPSVVVSSRDCLSRLSALRQAAAWRRRAVASAEDLEHRRVRVEDAVADLEGGGHRP